MKKNTKLSKSSWIVLIISLILACICLELILNDYTIGLWLSIFPVVLALVILWYMPLSLRIKDDKLEIRSSLHIKVIPISEIESVSMPESMETTADGKDKADSVDGGHAKSFMEGRYESDPFTFCRKSGRFLVTLKNGKRILLSCNDSVQFVNALKEKLPRA